MISKVLGIVGSPRKEGYTSKLVGAVLSGAQSAGADTQIIFLGEKNIEFCLACLTCGHEGECIHNDDMREVLSLMYESQIWVIGTPVYWLGPSAQMKVFMDRWFQDEVRLKNTNNRKIILAVPFESRSESTARHLIGMFRDSFDYLGKEIQEVILMPGTVTNGETILPPALYAKAFEAGKNAADLINALS